MSVFRSREIREQRTIRSAIGQPETQAPRESSTTRKRQRARRRDRNKSGDISPIVTIFGAGIAGLSAAHELIERGFLVQVVESERTPDEEYEVEVGGLARNQFGRVPANPDVLHATARTGGAAEKTDGITEGPEVREETFRNGIERIQRLRRSNAMQPVQRRFATPWRIGFDRNHPKDRAVDLERADDWGVKNSTKLIAAWDAFTEAYETYRQLVAEAERRVARRPEHERLDDDWAAREILYVEVRGHTDDSYDEDTNRDVSKAWACRVIDHLCTLNKPQEQSDGADEEGKAHAAETKEVAAEEASEGNAEGATKTAAKGTKDEPAKDDTRRNCPPLPCFKAHFEAVGIGSAEPLGDQRDEDSRRRSNRVEFRIVERLIPGEHGYRFFPAFYRHIFDVMRRTPILDETGHATGQTAFDRLVPTTELGLAVGDGQPSATVRTARVQSVEELRQLSALFLGRLKVTHRDVARFQSRLLKFLTSSAERREREYEDMSWWHFLGGDDERGYSPEMKRYLMDTSQALVAMNAEETDARSHGNIVAQLQLHYLKDRFDCTLNGPTSDVWLRPWKRYLKQQGVRFFVGELSGLEWKATGNEPEELVPVTAHKSGWLGARLKKRPSSTTTAREGARVEEPLSAQPLRRAVVVDVLGTDPGDYVVRISGKPYCVSAIEGETREEIAQALADAINADDRLRVCVEKSRILIQQRMEERLDLRAQSYEFDRSPDSADRMELVVLDHESLTREISDTIKSSLQRILKKAEKELKKRDTTAEPRHDEDQRFAGDAPDDELPEASEPAALPRLSDEEWIAVARLRCDAEFNERLSKLEHEYWQREIAPCLEYDSGTGILHVSPPEWVKIAMRKRDTSDHAAALDDTGLLCPYYFRLRFKEKSTAFTAAQDVPAPDAAVESPSPSASDDARAYSEIPTAPGEGFWIRVRNAHDNLRVLGEPIPEDPRHNYLSSTEAPPTFRPDFYVLALPLVAASKVLWRAEHDRPGKLHGSLAEILAFDRATKRVTARGGPVRIIRDAHGRPPFEHPLRDFAGVQYYFQNQVRIGSGHIYYPRAEWGLSSISQLAYWRERMSPASPFIGQLSVDIGNFYQPGAARNGNRLRRSAWNSCSEEIADQVWFQIREGLDRERAGVLAAPSFYHLDQGLHFDHTRGSIFRERVEIRVRSAPRSGGRYTVWVHGRPFLFNAAPKQSASGIAGELQEQITRALSGMVTASCRSVPGAGLPQRSRPPGAKGVGADRPEPCAPLADIQETEPSELLSLHSTVPELAAVVSVLGKTPGLFQLTLDGKIHGYINPASGSSVRAIRDRLFWSLVNDPAVPVTAEPLGNSRILLMPRGAKDLPRIEVRNDAQELDVFYGQALPVRLEQAHGRLEFERDATATVAHNATPFLINLPSQWKYRPGLLKPDDLTFEQIILRPKQDERIRYRISNRRWVAAGTHMATTTQLTTMESANESARHAVNAILRCLAFRPGDDYNSQGSVFADLADVWDPEKNELDDLESLKRLDRKLVDEGLPHVMDILKITDAIDAIPMHGKASHDPMANALHLLQHIASGLDKDWGFAKQTLNDLLGQAVERGNDFVDPLGVLRELRHGSAQITERIRDFLTSLTSKGFGGAPASGAGAASGAASGSGAGGGQNAGPAR